MQRRNIKLLAAEGVEFTAPDVVFNASQEINHYRVVPYAAQKGEGAGLLCAASGGVDSGFSINNEFNGLAEQGILCGVEYEKYFPFEDEPKYQKDLPTWLKVLLGVALAALVGLAVGHW